MFMFKNQPKLLVTSFAVATAALIFASPASAWKKQNSHGEKAVADIRGVAKGDQLAPAQHVEYVEQDYSFDRFANDVKSIPLELALTYGATIGLGFTEWDWGSSSFGFKSEGFFGKNTANGGMDKLGHAWSSYVLSDVFARRIRRATGDRHSAAISGALLAMGVQTMVEVFDGFSSSHGFSYEDMVMNAAGATFSYLRQTVPGMDKKIDFRLEYIPSGNVGGFRPHSDYSGQKYLLAFKLSGFEVFEETPLRFLEIHAGYFARGFTAKEASMGISRRRETYIGIGLNLQRILLGDNAENDNVLEDVGRSALQYFQVPYTYYGTRNDW
ncbi:MAG: DUF2279 domain-containing protein [Pseudomonadota bacterium]